MYIDWCRLSPRKLMLRWRSGSMKLLGSALLIILHGGISTPVFLPGEFYGQRSLVGYSPWGHKQSDTTEWLGTGAWGKGGRRYEAEGQVGLYNLSRPLGDLWCRDGPLKLSWVSAVASPVPPVLEQRLPWEGTCPSIRPLFFTEAHSQRDWQLRAVSQQPSQQLGK